MHSPLTKIEVSVGYAVGPTYGTGPHPEPIDQLGATTVPPIDQLFNKEVEVNKIKKKI